MSDFMTIFMILLAYTVVVYCIANKSGYERKEEEIQEIIDDSTRELEKLIAEANVMNENEKNIVKYKKEHDELKSKFWYGDIDADEFVREYNKLIEMESRDMEKSDPPGIPHEHI